jgi:hypothetical protein
MNVNGGAEAQLVVSAGSGFLLDHTLQIAQYCLWS